jgi:phage terminase small subunit
MARPGRKPKPTALHELHGTFNATKHGRDRAGEPEPPGASLSEPPDFLSPGQLDAWRYAVAHAPLNVLRPIDRGMLLIWVEAEDRLRRAMIAQAAIDEKHPNTPLLVPLRRKDGALALAESPYLRVISRAAETMIRAAGELGFSPAARPRLAAGGGGAQPPEPNDPWARLKMLQHAVVAGSS